MCKYLWPNLHLLVVYWTLTLLMMIEGVNWTNLSLSPSITKALLYFMMGQSHYKVM